MVRLFVHKNVCAAFRSLTENPLNADCIENISTSLMLYFSILQSLRLSRDKAKDIFYRHAKVGRQAQYELQAWIELAPLYISHGLVMYAERIRQLATGDFSLGTKYGKPVANQMLRFHYANNPAGLSADVQPLLHFPTHAGPYGAKYAAQQAFLPQPRLR